MRQTVFIGFWIAVYNIWLSFYLLNQKFDFLHIDAEYRKSLCWSALLFLSFILFIFRNGAITWMANEFLKVAWALWFATIGIFILNCFGLFTNPYYILGIINLGTFIATLLILSAGGKHDLLND